MRRSVGSLGLLILALAASAAGQTRVFDPPVLRGVVREIDCIVDERPAPRPSPGPGREVAGLSSERCFAELDRRGVGYERAQAEGVAMPLRLRGPIGGVRIEGGSEVTQILDCRLAVALARWLEQAPPGLASMRHYSMYRPGARVAGTGRVSGHAHGLAIDLASIEIEGDAVEVERDWQPRERGADPCLRQLPELPGAASLRALVCAGVQADLFQVVLTPHHDRAHHNHVHLEVRPGVDWSFVR